MWLSVNIANCELCEGAVLFVLVDVGSDVELCNGENMTKINPFTNVSFLRITTILCAISLCLAALSDKQLCYDPNCSGN